MLEHLWKRQYDFQTTFFAPDSLTQEDRIKWTKEFILCAHQELAEVMNSMNWKSYHLYEKEYPVEHIKEEIVDTLKFVLNLCIVWGMNPEEIVKEFNRKSDIVEERIKLKNGKHI